MALFGQEYRAANQFQGLDTYTISWIGKGGCERSNVYAPITTSHHNQIAQSSVVLQPFRNPLNTRVVKLAHVFNEQGS